MDKSPNILIVEDSSTQAFKEQHLFEQDGFAVFLAHTGIDALKIVKARIPEIIISDIVMPEMDGYELCKAVKGDEALKNIPFVLLTGLSGIGDVIRGLSSGADDYIIKPYDNDYLLNKVKELLLKTEQDARGSDTGGLEISVKGEKSSITSSRSQILQFLISTYDSVIYKNSELEKAETELKNLNEQLKSKIDDLESSRETLKITEERFRTLVQMIPDIVYQIDKKGRFTFVNNAVHILGYSPGELIGKHFRTILLHEDAERYSSSKVLKKFRGLKTGGEDAPKLFDERRAGSRTTRDLQLRLLTKFQSEPAPGNATIIDDELIVVEVDCSGLYETNEQTETCEFAGTVGVVRDVTKRILGEKQMHHLASFPQININPILEVNTGGAITFVNKAAFDTLNNIGCPDNMELFFPDDFNEILKKLEEKQEIQLYREVRIKNRFFGENIHLIPAFNVARIYTTDISCSKHKEDEIRKLSAAVEQSPSVVLITNTKGIIEYVNPRFSQLTGYSKDEVLGRTTKFLKSEQQMFDIFDQLWQTITSGKEWRGEFHHVKKNGDFYWEFASVSPIRNANGEITHFVKVAEEITARKEAEQKLQKSEKRFAGILDIAQDAIISMDESMRIIIFNKGAENIFGYSTSEMVGASITNLFPEKVKDEYRSKINKFSNSNAPSKRLFEEQYDLCGLRKNGEEFQIEASISQLDEETGKIFTIVLRDITQRKQTENELLKYQEKLENLVSERTKELQTTYEQLIHSEKLSAAGQLSASVAHEFNNPIFGIRNVLEILKEKTTEDNETHSFLDMAMRECDRMSGLIEKLRDFHRPTSGKKLATNIHDIIEDTLMLTKTKLKSRNIKVVKDYTDNMPEVNVVPDQIKQVVLNLINNAEQAIAGPDGGTIAIQTKICEDMASIRFKDNGIGIREDHIASIFDPFFSTKSIKGTGLGLSISHSIIREHGGDINVESKLCHGTTFTITLPLRAS